MKTDPVARQSERHTWHAKHPAKPATKPAQPAKSKRPQQIGGFKPHDIVITALGKHAEITECRFDGKLDAKYLGTPWQRGPETILDPKHLKHSNLADLLTRQISWLARELDAEQRLPWAAAECRRMDRLFDAIPLRLKARAWLWAICVIENASAYDTGR